MMPDKNRGFALAFVVMVVLILSIAIPSFYYLAYSHYNVAILDSYNQQARYNADSGIEYARFIIEHKTNYDPINYTGGSGKSPWPKTNSFTCFPDDPGKGTVLVAIADDPFNGTSPFAGGYVIRSTGTVRNNITAVKTAHYMGGVIDTWNQ